MSFVNVLMVALVAVALPQAHGWMTSAMDYMDFTCPAGQIMWSLESEHNDLLEDRTWNFFCKSLQSGVTLGSCSWSNYVNNYDQTFDYTCPSNSVLAGIRSFFSNSANDRRFSFYCCPLNGATTSSCAQTGYLNSYDDPLHFDVGCLDAIVGMKSMHNNWHEDRRFDIHYCAMS